MAATTRDDEKHRAFGGSGKNLQVVVVGGQVNIRSPTQIFPEKTAHRRAGFPGSKAGIARFTVADIGMMPKGDSPGLCAFRERARNVGSLRPSGGRPLIGSADDEEVSTQREKNGLPRLERIKFSRQHEFSVSPPIGDKMGSLGGISRIVVISQHDVKRKAETVIGQLEFFLPLKVESRPHTDVVYDIAQQEDKIASRSRAFSRNGPGHPKLGPPGRSSIPQGDEPYFRTGKAGALLGREKIRAFRSAKEFCSRRGTPGAISSGESARMTQALCIVRKARGKQYRPQYSRHPA